ncbi:MAG: hypothetical protein ACRD1B_08600 [Thermoanaerobaculia bacterium]
MKNGADQAPSLLAGRRRDDLVLGGRPQANTPSVWSVTMIRSLSYSWGLYPSADAGMPIGPRVAVMWSAANLPPEVAGAFASEGIGGLAGTFGDETFGEPVEIDDLDVEMDTGRVRIRVYNRGIGLMRGMGPELLQLHRFFTTIHAAANSGPSPEAT